MLTQDMFRTKKILTNISSLFDKKVTNLMSSMLFIYTLETKKVIIMKIYN